MDRNSWGMSAGMDRHPIQSTKAVLIISIERHVIISSTTSYNSSFPFYSLRSSWVFSQPKRKSRMVQYPGYTMTAPCVWIGKHPISLGLPLRRGPLHCPYESEQGFASFVGIWRHFLSDWTQHFFTKEWWISYSIFWQPAWTCNPINSLKNDQHSFPVCNCPFDTNW
jgi:hypothetical protein